MFGLGFPEMVIVLVAVVVLFFGNEKISEIGKELGKFTGSFKKGKQEMEKEIKKVKKEFKQS